MAVKLKANNGHINLQGSSVIRGIDGGYYIPNVDAEGNLTWIAVKDGMPEVEAANIKGMPGDKGESGVYIGDAPGEEDLVWIDPEGGIGDEVITRQEVEDMIAEIELGDFDLSTYAKITDIPKKVSELVNDAGYLTAHQDLSDYALKSEIPNLDGYALKSEIPSTSGLATTEYVDSKFNSIEIPEVNLSNYALKSEIPDTSGFALKSEIPTNYTTMSAVEAKGYQTAEQVKALITAELGVIENGTY